MAVRLRVTEVRGCERGLPNVYIVSHVGLDSVRAGIGRKGVVSIIRREDDNFNYGRDSGRLVSRPEAGQKRLVFLPKAVFSPNFGLRLALKDNISKQASKNYEEYLTITTGASLLFIIFRTSSVRRVVHKVCRK